MNYVQCFVNNISFPKSLEELWKTYIQEHEQFNIEDILYEDAVAWTCPRWAKVGDIVFFMHSKTARSIITKLISELKQNKKCYSNGQYTEMMDWLHRGLDLHNKYGGKIFAVGVVDGLPRYEGDDDRIRHWSSNIYCDIINVTVFSHPIDINDFRDFIYISRCSGITPVFGDSFSKVCDLIAKYNDMPYFLKDCTADEFPLLKIDSTNWYTLSNQYRRAFMYEAQFRIYYVNYFLHYLSDIKRIYEECLCHKHGHSNTFVDNIILFHGKYLPVEVKLSVSLEKDIYGQLCQYCGNDDIVIDRKTGRKVASNKIYSNNVLVVDTDSLYVYNDKYKSLNHIFDLDLLSKESGLKMAYEEILKQVI